MNKLGVTIHAVMRKCGQIGPDDFEMYSNILDIDENETMGSVIRRMMEKERQDRPRGMHFEIEVDV